MQVPFWFGDDDDDDHDNGDDDDDDDDDDADDGVDDGDDDDDPIQVDHLGSALYPSLAVSRSHSWKRHVGQSWIKI